ncbi:MAG: tRNA lysidine(34) synthetase TilS [Firmicutes bacterium]|nr:tRNA lysidine(34) synthetase TilS [Bacillota bacterium]
MKNIVKDVRERALATIEKYSMLTEGMSVVIGFSGGPDSLCLFDLLLDLKDELGLNLYPVHINHNLRGEASDSDQRFCEEFAHENRLTLRVFTFDCKAAAEKEGITTEEAGRNFRYESFLEVAAEAKSVHPEADVAIAVAQNADDQAETVLMRILRGTGVDGLSGIPYKRPATRKRDVADGQAAAGDRTAVNIIRPLLDIYRKEILEFCKEKNLEPCIDQTNDEPLYSRNKLRLELIPKLEKDYNPNVKEALLRLAAAAADDRTMLESLAESIYKDEVRIKADDTHGAACAASIEGTVGAAGIVADNSRIISLDRHSLIEAEPAVRRRVIALALKDAGLTEDVGSVHYEAIADVLSSDNPSAKTNLPNGYSVWRVYGTLKMGKKAEGVGNCDGEGRELGSFEVKELTIDELDSIEKVPNTYCAFDLDLMKRELGEKALSRLELRGRRPGDEIKTEGGTKKIKDLLIDMKVPKDERDDVRLLTVGNQVLWVIPEGESTRPRYTSKWKITGETEKIAYIVLIV